MFSRLYLIFCTRDLLIAALPFSTATVYPDQLEYLPLPGNLLLPVKK